jgi:hypothetical protein
MLLLVAVGCHDARSVQLLAPEAAQRSYTREDSVAAGYFERNGTSAQSATVSVASTTCSSDCVALISADPGLFQGYTQPNPITLTLAGRVGSVTVVGQGSIQCSGSYGDLIGYDAAGAEIGRTSLQLIDPADCSPDWNPDNVTYGAQATLTTTVPIARAVITPMSPLEFTVRGNCCGHASATYSVSLAAIPLPEIKVTCTGPFQRTEVIKCTAEPPDAAQTLAVASWSFTSIHFERVERAANPTSTTWEGQLVTDGDILVTGTLDGKEAESKPVHVSVIARDWTDKKATQKIHTIVFPSTLPVRPTAFKGQLGQMEPNLIFNAGASSVVSDDGPNESMVYLTDLPVTTQTKPQVNTNALTATSDFYKIQETQTRKIGQITYCGKSVVTDIIPGVETHEGYDPTTKDSHAEIYRRHVDSLAYVVFEPATNLLNGANISASVDGLHEEAFNDSDSMDTDSRNKLTTPSNCVFRYDYSRLK